MTESTINPATLDIEETAAEQHPVLPRVEDICRKPDGRVNNATVRRLTQIGRCLFKKLIWDGERIEVDDEDEDEEREEGRRMPALYLNALKITQHTETLTRTPEGRALLRDARELCNVISRMHQSMAAVKGLKYRLDNM